ncbi:PepSY-associated TM helix domain-containing protein, partial [Vibrio cholerae]
MSTVTTPQPTAAARRKNLYFLTWRWHFYAGLFVVPFMLMLALTGLVMLFDDEIEQARYAEVLNVTPQTQVMPVSQQLAAVQKAYPEAQVTQFIPALQLDLANRFSVLFSDGSTQFVTVNPYSAVVLGTIDRSESWYEWANSIHGTLLIGDWGDYLIEVAASLGMILLVSGIYLWLPIDNARKAGFLKIRVGSGARIFWRDLHANLGGMLSLVLLFFLISGLSWAGIWGGKLVQAWNTFPTYYTWG